MIDNLISSQPDVYKLLSNSFHSNRVSHAYLFNGPKGTGKIEMAKLFSKMIYCLSDKKPCNECKNCKTIDANSHLNVFELHYEGNTIKKDNILNLQHEFSLTSFEEGPRIYIIRNVENFTQSAANSLLKFIEEPESENTIGILTTENVDSVLRTIQSRCQIVHFKPLKQSFIASELVKYDIEVEHANILATLSGDIIFLKEYYDEENFIEIYDITINFIEEYLTNCVKAAVLLKSHYNDIQNIKVFPRLFFNILSLFFEEAVKFSKGIEPVIFIKSKALVENYTKHFNYEQLSNYFLLALDFANKYSNKVNKNLFFDNFIIKILGGK